ncbi:MAG: class I SAM-dependent methyltransferase [Patescibacteria group bacterium]|nr:class I SAM-dependent methyltransferase [Patescibacteria group bacterium]
MLEEKYLNLLKERWKIYSSIFGMKNFKKRMERRINREGGKRSLEELKKLISIKNKKLLDVGSCCGEFLFEAVNEGVIGYGVEPDELSLETSKLLFSKENQEVVLENARAENLPFDIDTFDIVVSIFIIEHIKNYQQAILEMVRVLKPGGVLWLKCPNYLYPYEFHYKRYYFPFLPKFIEQIYFNIVSDRRSEYFTNLTRITPCSLVKFLKKNNFKFKDLSLETVKSKNLFYRVLHKIGIYSQINLVIYK